MEVVPPYSEYQAYVRLSIPLVDQLLVNLNFRIRSRGFSGCASAVYAPALRVASGRNQLRRACSALLARELIPLRSSDKVPSDAQPERCLERPNDAPEHHPQA